MPHFARPVKVFDCHSHVFPDHIAARSLEVISQGGGVPPRNDGTRRGLAARMRECGITGALNCPIATRPGQVESINRWAADHNAWPILSLGTIHPDTPDVQTVLAGVGEAGLRGVKLHPEYQEFDVDEARLEPVWETCEELGLLVLIHAGRDVAFLDQEPRCRPAALRGVLDRHPRLDMIAAHFGGWRMWDETEEYLLGTRVYLDTAFVAGWLDRERVLLFIERHGPDRILFGTDTPWADPGEELDRVRDWGLDQDVEAKILWRNAARLLNLKPPASG